MRSCRFLISTLGPAHLGALGPRNTFTANRSPHPSRAFFFSFHASWVVNLAAPLRAWLRRWPWVGRGLMDGFPRRSIALRLPNPLYRFANGVPGGADIACGISCPGQDIKRPFSTTGRWVERFPPLPKRFLGGRPVTNKECRSSGRRPPALRKLADAWRLVDYNRVGHICTPFPPALGHLGTT